MPVIDLSEFDGRQTEVRIRLFRSSTVEAHFMNIEINFGKDF